MDMHFRQFTQHLTEIGTGEFYLKFVYVVSQPRLVNRFLKCTIIREEGKEEF